MNKGGKVELCWALPVEGQWMKSTLKWLPRHLRDEPHESHWCCSACCTALEGWIPRFSAPNSLTYIDRLGLRVLHRQPKNSWVWAHQYENIGKTMLTPCHSHTNTNSSLGTKHSLDISAQVIKGKNFSTSFIFSFILTSVHWLSHKLTLSNSKTFRPPFQNINCPWCHKQLPGLARLKKKNPCILYIDHFSKSLHSKVFQRNPQTKCTNVLRGLFSKDKGRILLLGKVNLIIAFPIVAFIFQCEGLTATQAVWHL